MNRTTWKSLLLCASALAALVGCTPLAATSPPAAASNAKGHPTATPAAVKVSFIDQAVMAKGVQSDTYEPINVTTTFSPNDPATHFVVHLQDAPGGTRLKATLVQDDVIELATVSVTTPDGGWETGNHSEIEWEGIS